jgi:FdhE protein
VASQFIRNLLGRKPVLPPEVIEAQAELARLSDDRPVLAELAGQLGEYLAVIYAEPAAAIVGSITTEVAAEKLAAGVPLLRGEVASFGPGPQRRLSHLVAALARFQPAAAAPLAKTLRADGLVIEELTAAVLDGEPQRIHERLASLGLDVSLTAFLLVLALYPELVVLRTSVQPLLSANSWEKGYCPVCGGYAKLGEYRGLEQNRLLRCSLCAAEWPFPRLRCPSCGQRDHRQLGFLHVEGEENKCRAATCDQCRLYVKMVSTLGPLAPLELLVTDVATVHLDLIAADKGYLPPM